MGAKRFVSVYLKGMAMGAADVVPGVSGGTVAFITGIYEELIGSIRSISPHAVTILVKQGVAACWEHINGNFLLTLLLGIITSIFSLARIITYLLEAQPLLVWSFFFGLIAASSVHMAKQVKQWNLTMLAVFIIGLAFAFVVGELKPSEVEANPLIIFLSGSIAICAMILPGISGSFILVLLGMYAHILEGVKQLDMVILLSFAAGCVIGILTFAQILSWLFKRFHDLTLVLLTGFLVGSLNLVWPWKETLSYYTNSDGERLALEQNNVLPATFEATMATDSSTWMCIGLMVVGLLLVIFLEQIGKNTVEKP